MTGSEWYRYSRAVRRFGVILRAADLIEPDDKRYAHRPEGWDREHRIWVSLDEPEPPRDQLTTLNWERFVARSRKLRRTDVLDPEEAR